ncbi:MAG TPA: response regulator [Myxococcaceae bacterium]|nr:response regulator [Myxococcaceae bacterium]
MKRVLVVDDERDVADALGELLGEHYAVIVAYDGTEALGLLETGGADLIVLDLMMPVMSGEALMSELQARGLTVPVILASAAADLQERARRSSANDFIAKPFDFEELERKVARLIGPAGGGGSSPGAGAVRTQRSSEPEGGEEASAPRVSSGLRRSTARSGLSAPSA